MGIANAWIEPAWGPLRPPLAAVSMPMTLAVAVDQGTPGVAGRIGALVWIMPVRFSRACPVWSDAVMDCPSAVTWPRRPPVRPRAFGVASAVTLSPT